MGSFLRLSPMFRTRLVQIRKAKSLTQQALADSMGIHVNQIKRYESGQSDPSLDALVRLARALHVSLDDLVFDENERGPSDELALQFEAVSRMSDEERHVVKTLLDGMILQHEARRWTTAARPASPKVESHP
jgi:transcriptional regulator with XRE-family HTH domain